MRIPVGHGQVTFEFSGGALPFGAAVTCGFQDVLAADPAAEAAIFSGIFQDTLLVGLTNDVTLANTHVKQGPQEDGPSGDFASAITGSGSDPSTSPNVAYLVRKQSASGGRKNRGRFYLPGVSEDSIDQQGIIDGAALADQQDRADAFLLAAAVEDLPLEILHTGPGAPTIITSLTFDAVIATQRRRLRR